MITHDKTNIGSDVPEMLPSDLDTEYAVDARLKTVIALCESESESESDFVTRDMLVALLDDTETDHSHFLEQQLRLIKTIGLPNYLQAQIGSRQSTS